MLKTDTVIVEGKWNGKPCAVTFYLDGDRWRVLMIVDGKEKTTTVDKSTRVGRSIAAELLATWMNKKPVRRRINGTPAIEPRKLRVVG